MKKIVFLSVFYLSSLLFIPPAYALLGFHAEAGVGIGEHDLSGDIQYRGDKIDLKDTLGMGKETQTTFKLKFEHPVPIVPNIYYHYIPSSFTAKKTSTETIGYGGQTFQASTVVTSEVNITRHDIGLFYNVPFVGLATLGILDLEFGINAKLLDFTGSLEGQVVGTGMVQKEEKAVTVPIPQLYAGFSITPIGLVSLNGEIKYISIDGNTLSEIDVSLRIRPLPFLYITVGYFMETLKVDTEDLVTDITTNAPYLMIGAEF